MKLHQLKKAVHYRWQSVIEINEAVVQPEQFKDEIRRQFGDLRYKATWEKALARFYAQIIHDACLDAWGLILYGLNFKPGDRFYEYRHQIFEEFIAFPDGMELLKAGLEQIFYSNDFTPQERKEAQGNGFFELVREQSAGRGVSGRAVELAGQLRGVA